MKRYAWYTVREVLKQFQVQSAWLSSSDLLAFAGPNGVAVLHKANSIQPEIVHLLLDELGIAIDEFERAYRTHQDT